MNNFFKEETDTSNQANKRIKNTSFNGVNDLLELKKNPWKLFPNHNQEFEDNLSELINLKIQYQNALNGYQQLLEIKENFSKNPSYKLHELIFMFFLNFSFASVFLAYIFQSSISSSNLLLYSLSIGALLLFFINLFFRKSRTQNSNLIASEMIKKEENFREIEKEYNKKVKKFLKNQKYLNIRDSLDYYYHSDIPELNHIVQEFINESFSKTENLSITNEIGDNLQRFTISKCNYVEKIKNYIDLSISEKIKLVILDKALSGYSHKKIKGMI